MEPRDSTGLPLSVTYVKTEAKRLHPLFSGDVSYDRINDEFVPPQTLRPEPNLVKADLSDLQQALETYQRVQEARGLAGTSLEFKDPADCTWDDVTRAVFWAWNSSSIQLINYFGLEGLVDPLNPQRKAGLQGVLMPKRNGT